MRASDAAFKVSAEQRHEPAKIGHVGVAETGQEHPWPRTNTHNPCTANDAFRGEAIGDGNVIRQDRRRAVREKPKTLFPYLRSAFVSASARRSVRDNGRDRFPPLYVYGVADRIRSPRFFWSCSSKRKRALRRRDATYRSPRWHEPAAARLSKRARKTLERRHFERPRESRLRDPLAQRRELRVVHAVRFYITGRPSDTRDDDFGQCLRWRAAAGLSFEFSDTRFLLVARTGFDIRGSGTWR